MWKSVLGALLCLMGAIWFLQGIDALGGSGMSGHVVWSWIGAAVVLIGAWLLVGNIVRRRLRP
ncbi:MAG: hypothetical protein JF603_12980 [Acidobacteria bacterium]|nr:hypothetical protein [Acidobacteriota bacterium]